MLPRIRIDFSNGNLGQVQAMPDGVFALITTAAPVSDKLTLLETYVVHSLDDAQKRLGITPENNPGLMKVLIEFYSQAEAGTELWLKCFAETVSLTQMASLQTENGVQQLLQQAQGRIRGLFVHFSSRLAQTVTLSGGLNQDVWTAAAAAQQTANWSAQTLKAPLFAIISGIDFSGNAAELTDLTTLEFNRVGVMLGDTTPGKGCAIGLLAGRLAHIPVHRNIARVKDGAVISLSQAYIGDTPAEEADIDLIHDKGYISLRQHTGKAGYYFTDDPLAAPASDDYNHLTARRTIDKAYRIAYESLLPQLLNEVSLNDEGQVSVTFAKSIETSVENAIINAMTLQGELGNDPGNANDTGVQCYIDPAQNLVQTGLLKVHLRIKPFGYARYINVELGFKTNNG